MAILIGYGNSGWLMYSNPEAPGPVWVRYREGDSGRLEVAEVHVAFEDVPGTPSRWRDLASALSAVEAEVAANEDEIRKWVRRPAKGDVRKTLEMNSTSRHRPRKEVPREAFEAALRLEVPTTKPYPAGFFREVALAYHAALQLGDSAPARRIAEENDVPVKTVHGWVAAARRQGALPPARRGRAG